jgi:chaperonin GroEL (HSP60 family)
LQTAVSVAALLLTTEATIVSLPTEDGGPSIAPAGMNGMM